jgi:hypothetical protein
MFDFDLGTVALLAAVGAGIYFVIIPKAGAVKKRVEARRTRSVHLASWAKVNGLPILAGLFSKYAVGDISGTIASLDQIHDLLADDDLAKQSIDGFLKVQFNKAVETAEGRENLVRLIEEKFSVSIPREQIAALSQQKQKLTTEP